MNKKIIVITGPTASGKTESAINLAKKIDAEIICADSRIVYRNLDIVSAKPSLKERETVVHHLIDIVDIDEEFSAGDFVKKAREIINNTDKNIIISGGTWFYIKSLLDSKALINSSQNKELRIELNKLESEDLWKKLESLDKKRANEIHPNNREKVIRSIEMCIELNMPLSEYKRKENQQYNARWYMRDIQREELYQRINSRVDFMAQEGLFEEWEKNSNAHPNSKLLYNTIGYREFFDFKNGIYDSIESAYEKIKQHTRNFAKRQLTYFNNNKNIKLYKNDDEILGDIERWSD